MNTLVLNNDVTKNYDFRFNNAEALIIKVTNKCNIECSYCYENTNKKGDIMSIEVFYKIIEKAILSTSKQIITVIFHGGEPLLLPTEWYSKAINYCDNISSVYNKQIFYGLQTNFVSVSDQKIYELKKLGINISASLDAGDLLNNEREFSNKTLENLYRAKALSLNISILSTINNTNYHSFIPFMEFLYNKFGIINFKANVAYPVGFGKDTIPLSDDKIIKAKIDILKYMIENEGLKINDLNLIIAIKKFFENKSNCNNSLCDKKTCGAGKEVLGFNQDGEMLPCGRFTWDDKLYYLSNIYDEPNEVDYYNRVENFQNKHNENWQDCDNCDAKKICNFGCQAFITRSNTKLNIECKSTKVLHENFKENKSLIEKIYLNNQNSVSTYNDYNDYRR
jgi:uncharacterized protein